ncbi:MAG: hypothetical protein ACJA0Q_001808 [Saprospiraceae bacterium]|jgi:uncharacterized protein (TIGR02231 family)
MRKVSSLLIGMVLFTGVGIAQELVSKIEGVTVFERGAQVNRKAIIKVKKGISLVVIKNLSRYVDANSIQAKVPGAKIVSLNYSLDYLTNEESNTEKRLLEDSLATLNHDLKVLNNRRQINQQELKLIQKNVDIKGQAVLDVADLEDFLIFYRSNLPLIKGSLLSIEEKEEKVKKQVQKLKNELRSLKSSSQKVSGKIEIELSSAVSISANLSLNFYVSNAGWSPYYNLRATALDEPIEMEFNAQVYQNTGVEWKEIALSLATGTPHLDGNAPQLNTWYVNYRRVRSGNRFKFRGGGKKEKYKESELNDDQHSVSELTMSVSANSLAIPTDNITFREYKINEPYNISSDGKRQRVEITKHKLEAQYAYFCAPKINTSAYLIAKVSNWEQYNILSGHTKIYFEDTYVGQGYIDARNTEDTLQISLGQDKNIVIERITKLDKSGKQLIGLKQSKKKAYDIVVRNNKKSAIKIEVVDQIPVSKNNAIKVKLVESSSAKINPETGELKWLLEIGSFGKETRSFEFEISYPKNKKITL